MKHFARQRPSTLVATLVMCVVTACGGKSSADDDDPSTGGTSGDGDGDGTGASIGDGDGDESGTGGASTGGGTSTGGQGGSVPTLPTLGDECDEAGLSSCSGNNEKLTLICGADGAWAAGAVCGSGEICDWRPSSASFGSCVEQNAACAGAADGTLICDGDDLLECIDDGLGVQRWPCGLGCEDGGCLPGDDCPPSSVVNCAGDCGAQADACFGVPDCAWVELESAAETVVRVSASATCTEGVGLGCEETFIPIYTTSKGAWLRVTVGEGWQMVAFEGIGSYWSDLCAEEHFTGCVVVPASNELHHGVALIPEEGAPPRNVQVEVVPIGTECP